jgi:F-type H+-transporting ATPase subunit alpha
MVELLKQGQYQPLVVERQIAIIFAGTQGLLDDMPVDQIRAFEEFLFGFLDRKHAPLLADIANKKELTDELRSGLAAAINAAKAEFMAARGIKAA